MIIGQIEKIEISEGVGKTGNTWKRWCFTLEGKKYSTFKAEIGEKFKAGDRVKIDGKQDGKFFNMETMDYAEEGEVATATPSQTPDRTGKIARMACMKAAVEFLKDGNEVGTEVVLACADQFVEWVNKEEKI